MKKGKVYILVLVSFLFVIIIYLLNKSTYSLNSGIDISFLGNNMDSLNSVLKMEEDINNPYILDEIVDVNGNVPASEYYTHIASRSIKELRAYDGKIFMGLGDWNDNTGPVKILYYDTVSKKIMTSGTVADEAIESFNIIHDNNNLEGIYLETADYDKNKLYDLQDIMKLARKMYNENNE